MVSIVALLKTSLLLCGLAGITAAVVIAVPRGSESLDPAEVFAPCEHCNYLNYAQPTATFATCEKCGKEFRVYTAHYPLRRTDGSKFD